MARGAINVVKGFRNRNVLVDTSSLTDKYGAGTAMNVVSGPIGNARVA
jgi:hypothetical protein